MKFTPMFVMLVGLSLAAGPALVPDAAAADPCRLPAGLLKAADLAARSAVECGLAGRLVDLGDGVSLPVQPPGSGVTLNQLTPTGAHTYTSSTDTAGVVTTSKVTTPAASRLPDLPGPGPCERDSYLLGPYKWYRPWLYRTTSGTTLGAGTQADFDAASRRATANLTRGRNTCGLRGGIRAAAAYLGHTVASGNFLAVDGQTTCGASDHQNVIDQGDLPGDFLTATMAWTCTWTETRRRITRAVSADIRLNNADYRWTYHPDESGCDPALPPDPQRWRYDVESVLTHEVGHVFGLVNLSSADDVNQTMYPGIRRCSGHRRSLGRGDVLGMRALYGPGR